MQVTGTLHLAETLGKDAKDYLFSFTGRNNKKFDLFFLDEMNGNSWYCYFPKRKPIIGQVVIIKDQETEILRIDQTGKYETVILIEEWK